MKTYRVAYRKQGIINTIDLSITDGKLGEEIAALEGDEVDIILITQIPPTIKPVIQENQT